MATPDRAFFEHRWAFESGDAGHPLRVLVLSSRTVDDARRALRTSGFHEIRKSLVADRLPDGAPQWTRTDGSATPDESDPAVVPRIFFLKGDALVDVWPLGDPRERRGPHAPFARKYVLFSPLVTAPEEADLSKLLGRKNRAFAVSDTGAVIPRSRRQHDGAFFDASDLLGSWSFANTIAAATMIRLLPSAP